MDPQHHLHLPWALSSCVSKDVAKSSLELAAGPTCFRHRLIYHLIDFMIWFLFISYLIDLREFLNLWWYLTCCYCHIHVIMCSGVYRYVHTLLSFQQFTSWSTKHPTIVKSCLIKHLIAVSSGFIEYLTGLWHMCCLRKSVSI